MADNKNFNLIPSQTTRKIWNKVSVQVNIPAMWVIFNKIALGQAITSKESHDLFDLFLCMGIVVSGKLYPTEVVTWNSSTQTYENDHQLDELDGAIIKAYTYFSRQATAKSIIIAKFPTFPTTPVEIKRLYGLLFLKVLGSWQEEVNKEEKEPRFLANST